MTRRQCKPGGIVLRKEVPYSPRRSNSAVERDALHPALRASYSAPHRER